MSEVTDYFSFSWATTPSARKTLNTIIIGGLTVYCTSLVWNFLTIVG